jgi:hypothetical protein
MTQYILLKPYHTQFMGQPVTLPVGTRLTWWEERGFYLAEAVNNIRVPVRKWTVEAWHDYFGKVEE